MGDGFEAGFSAWLAQLKRDQAAARTARGDEGPGQRTAVGLWAPHDQPIGDGVVSALESLVSDEGMRLALVISTQGLPLAAAGEVDELDLSSLAVLAAGNALTNEGVAALLRQGRFASQLHEGQHASVYVQLLDERAVLLVVFSPTVTFGLLRLRAREAASTVVEHLDELLRGAVDPNLCEGDVEALFRS